MGADWHDDIAVCPVCGRPVNKIRLMRRGRWVYIYAVHRDLQGLHQIMKLPRALWGLLEDYVVARRCR